MEFRRKPSNKTGESTWTGAIVGSFAHIRNRETVSHSLCLPRESNYFRGFFLSRLWRLAMLAHSATVLEDDERQLFGRKKRGTWPNAIPVTWEWELVTTRPLNTFTDSTQSLSSFNRLEFLDFIVLIPCYSENPIFPFLCLLLAFWVDCAIFPFRRGGLFITITSDENIFWHRFKRSVSPRKRWLITLLCSQIRLSPLSFIKRYIILIRCKENVFSFSIALSRDGVNASLHTTIFGNLNIIKTHIRWSWLPLQRVCIHNNASIL